MLAEKLVIDGLCRSWNFGQTIKKLRLYLKLQNISKKKRLKMVYREKPKFT